MVKTAENENHEVVTLQKNVQKKKQENNCVNPAQQVLYLNFFCGEADHTQCLRHNFPIILVTYRADSGTVSLRKNKTKQIKSNTVWPPLENQ